MIFDKITKNKLDNLFLVTILIVLFSIFVIIQLPLYPALQKTPIVVSVLLAVFIIFIIEKIKWPFSLSLKSFIESFILLAAVFVIVHFSGGIRSYFVFLYLIPILRISSSSTIFFTIIIWLFSTILLLVELFFFPQSTLKSSLGFVEQPVYLALLLSWSFAVVSGYGRYLAIQMQKVEENVTISKLEKERTVIKLKDEFLFIIAHELRGPITAIRGYLEIFLTETGKMSDRVKNSANAAFSESNKLNYLITELLDLSRIEVGKLQLNMEKFNVSFEINEVIRRYQNEAKEKNINIINKITSTNFQIYNDKERFQIVLNNLIENAIKYSKFQGNIWIWIEDHGKQLSITVADDGLGIPKSKQTHLFERFFNEKDSNVNNLEERSVGLGLFLSKKLIEKMGGNISFESHEGSGSKFTFSVPAT